MEINNDNVNTENHAVAPNIQADDSVSPIEMDYALDLVDQPILFVHSDRLHVFKANRSACEQYGLDRHHSRRKYLSDIVPALAEPRFVANLVRRVCVELETVHVSTTSVDRSGKSNLTSVTLFAGQGDPANLIVSLQPVNLHSAVNGQDELTGLFGKNTLMKRLKRLLSTEPPRRFALLFVDVDRFKNVNDSHGHIVGDDVLQTIACRLVDAVRPHDCVARYGGDEFLMLLEEVPNQQADVISRWLGIV